jgi:hypothetical protein
MFNSPEDFFEHLQTTIIDRHPQDLSIVLNAYGVSDEDATPLTLLALFHKHGKPFLEDLAAVLPEENAEGLFPKLVNLFEKGKEIVTDLKGAKEEKPTTTATDEKKPEAKKLTTKKIIIIGVVIITFLSVIVYFVTRKK